MNPGLATFLRRRRVARHCGALDRMMREFTRTMPKAAAASLGVVPKGTTS